MDVLPGAVQGNELVNALYGVLIPAAGHRVMGAPVEVHMLGPDQYPLYLPLMLTNHVH
jgi:hypothetical protein